MKIIAGSKILVTAEGSLEKRFWDDPGMIWCQAMHTRSWRQHAERLGCRW